MTDNRRSSFRHAVDLPVQVALAGAPATELRLGNLSMGGAYLANVVMTMGQRLSVAFVIPTQDAAIEVGAVVRWTDAGGVGIQFDGLRARDTWALGKYIEQLGK